MNEQDPIIKWLLDGDVSIQYQIHRDFLRPDKQALQNLQKRIAEEGWGARFLAERRDNGRWGGGSISPNGHQHITPSST